MLDNHEITFGCLTTYLGFILGLGLLTLSQILDVPDLARWGIAVLCLACTYSLHRSIEARNALLAATFEMGRQHERELTAIR